METSEEDAGAATNASRRSSARERDVGEGEDSGGVPRQPMDPAAVSGAASSSEEAYDGDSVPSPSQDLNTSTEAILDMIDEIVDGPDALRRRSCTSTDADVDCIRSDAEQPLVEPDLLTAAPPSPVPAISAKCETASHEINTNSLPESKTHFDAPTSDFCMEKVSAELVNKTSDESKSDSPTGDVTVKESMKESSDSAQVKCSTDKESTVSDTVPAQKAERLQVECPIPQEIINVNQDNQSASTESSSDQIVCALSSEVQQENVNKVEPSQESARIKISERLSEITRQPESPQASSSVAPNELAVSTPNESLFYGKCDLPSNLSPNIPSSSVTGTVSNVLDSSENQSSERTLKCVTSSDNRDNVTVESAESTSSEVSVRDNQAAVSDTQVRSPLRRRLVRPTPSDRRPDSTVSSSMDSQTHVDTTDQTTSESLTKDVSSSSDAVSSVYCKVKPEEIRNVSEISVCKAETSMSPPKKIKLVRQRTTPITAPKDLVSEATASTKKEQCQSTSSEYTPSTPTSLSSTQNVVVTKNLYSEGRSQGSSNDPIINAPVTNTPKGTSEKEQDIINTPHENQPSAIPETQGKVDHQQKKVPPLKLNLTIPESSEIKADKQEIEDATVSKSEVQELPESTKQVPKLTIKLGNKSSEEPKSPIPKLTIKPIRHPSDTVDSKKDLTTEQIPSITKINIKPITKPAEKINDIHRKSSSSEISESESSENDESNSMSDQTSNSDHGPSDVVPKVTIKVGKPGTESEGKFYTEQNVTKSSKNVLDSENIEQESMSKAKLKVTNLEETQPEKIPKLTIKTVGKSEGQPLSPKLTIKPIKPPENVKKDVLFESAETSQIPKLKISTESFLAHAEVKENAHIPKITIKPVLKTDSESASKTPKKSSVVCDSPEHIPIVTKLNIKPVLKPTESENIENSNERIPVVSKLNIKPIIKPVDSSDDVSEDSESQIPVISKLNIKPILKPSESGEKSEVFQDVPVVSKLNIKPIMKPDECDQACKSVDEKVPVVSKLNIKPIVKPKDNAIESTLDTIPKVTKLNIKPLRNPEAESSEIKDCDVLNADMEANSIPVVTKINIKPIVKPVDEDAAKDSENQSSETGNSSDDNTDHIPVVTKINIKPIIKPSEKDDSSKPNSSHEENIPVVTKLNIKPLIKPEDGKSPSSPKKENLKITKLNIKPLVKPEDVVTEDVITKNPPLVMKINIKEVAGSEETDDTKINNTDGEHLVNNLEENTPKISKLNIKPIVDTDESKRISVEPVQINCKQSCSQSIQPEVMKVNCVPESKEESTREHSTEKPTNLCNEKAEPIIPSKQVPTSSYHLTQTPRSEISKTNDKTIHSDTRKIVEHIVNQSPNRTHSTLQNCTLLKKLLETKKDGLDKRLDDSKVNSNHSLPVKIETDVLNNEQHTIHNLPSEHGSSREQVSKNVKQPHDIETDLTERNLRGDTVKKSTDSLTVPLEISISDKISNQSSGQDSPRIILKINKTDHGSSAKIITEDRPATPQENDVIENTQEIVNDKQSQKKVVNSRKKSLPATPSIPVGKRLRSSRILEEKTPSVKRSPGKRTPPTDTSPIENKEPELSVLESKRLKLGQLLSNKSLSNPPMNTKTEQVVPKQNTNFKMTNHSLLNNENCSKNGNSKLHNILSNLQAKQAQALALKDLSLKDKTSITPDLESNASTGSSDVVEVVPIENSHRDNQEIVISENSESRDLPATMDESARDPLEVQSGRSAETGEVGAAGEMVAAEDSSALTPTPKRRGRPRKVPVTTPVALPVPALEERPQRSLRLSRERPTPTILTSRRGRGRGRGARRLVAESPREEPVAADKPAAERSVEEEDPTSSRVKLPRMTEALDKLPRTPLSTRRRSSSASVSALDVEPKVVLDLLPADALRSPGAPDTPRRGAGRGGRGRGRTPARSPRLARGRGRGGGRGATYMKETMGIYGRVCGPATTTVVEIFEEETCMMDDNATPAKLSTYDEDSQSSVMSSTNDSTKMRKSKFADLFDSNKTWTAADVKEYTWPPPETPDVERQVMMIQEQVAMFLGVKSFKRRYPELKRRSIAAEERDFVLSQGLVTEALCDLGITAVDASEVLDIMLSDYPHKYEEYRSHQRQKQIAEAAAREAAAITAAESNQKMDRVEIKPETPKPVETKPEVPKVDLEKARQEAMAAAVASAAEFNSRLNISRRGACVDLQSNTIHRRRPPARPLVVGAVCPPTGFYPHALLPGQFQHQYRTYTAQQLRYFPLNTVLEAPPPPPSPTASDSDSEPDWGSSSSDDSVDDRPQAKRKKLTKTKRSSQAEGSNKEEVKEAEVETCRTCKLRLEANRKHTHERFLVCSTCHCNLHPHCIDLPADTIRRAREYPWQCNECKTCGLCSNSAANKDDTIACQLCDRTFHTACLPDATTVPSNGRWHCVECAVCKSCGARSPSGPPSAGPSSSSEDVTWHHQTKRGPGGHKVYSHSLCTPCARAYRIGRYCPLCERSFIGPKGTMQLVICKLCDRQHHQECVKATGCSLNVLDYTCSECRRGGITSRAAAARLAPRTIATLFMAKRRFNKYAHRQYLQSRKQQQDSASGEPKSDTSDVEPDASDPLEGVGDTLEGPSDTLEGPSDTLEGPSDTLEGPSDTLEGPSDTLESAPLESDETAAAVAALRMDFET